MAVQARKGKSGTSYRVLYVGLDGKQHSGGTYPTRKQATAEYGKLKAAVFKGVEPNAKRSTDLYQATVRGKGTVAAYAASWLPGHILSGHARETYTTILNGRILPEIGSKALGEVTPHTIRTWFRRLESEGVSGALLAKIKTVASAMFQTAAEDGLIPVNPLRGIKIKKDIKKRRHALTAEEYKRLLKYTPERFRLFVRTIVESGLRYEEALGLKGTDVIGCDIHVSHVLTELHKPTRFILEDRTKTGDGRIVRVSKELAAELRAAGNDFVFLWDGEHFRSERFRRTIWKPALKAAGISEDVTPRDLRRTHATLLRSGGADIETVRTRLGHSSIATTDRYLGERAETQDAALDALSVALNTA